MPKTHKVHRAERRNAGRRDNAKRLKAERIALGITRREHDRLREEERRRG